LEKNVAPPAKKTIFDLYYKEGNATFFNLATNYWVYYPQEHKPEDVATEGADAVVEEEEEQDEEKEEQMEDVAISESSESESESLPTTKLLDYGSIVFEKRYADNLKDLFLLKKPDRVSKSLEKVAEKHVATAAQLHILAALARKSTEFDVTKKAALEENPRLNIQDICNNIRTMAESHVEDGLSQNRK
jgi:hypothetical protein